MRGAESLGRGRVNALCKVKGTADLPWEGGVGDNWIGRKGIVGCVIQYIEKVIVIPKMPDTEDFSPFPFNTPPKGFSILEEQSRWKMENRLRLSFLSNILHNLPRHIHKHGLERTTPVFVNQ